jgi:hypothetical protein
MISFGVIVDTSFDMLVLLKNLSEFFFTNTTVMRTHHLTLCLVTNSINLNVICSMYIVCPWRKYILLAKDNYVHDACFV